jgi:hypothetical protein
VAVANKIRRILFNSLPFVQFSSMMQFTICPLISKKADVRAFYQVVVHAVEIDG